MTPLFPLFPVAPWLMLTLNIILWPIFHLGISKIALHIKDVKFSKDEGIYKTRRFEKDGRFYERVLFIRKWKKFIPDGASIFKAGFKKKKLEGTQKAYLNQFILETRRAEWTHLWQIAPCLVFFLFNTFWVAMIMVAYALLFNLPLIWLQRYNRIRFYRVLSQLD
jgi:glycosyl-4,4'-diaponeurosporenoate acyltransferase